VSLHVFFLMGFCLKACCFVCLFVRVLLCGCNENRTNVSLRVFFALRFCVRSVWVGWLWLF